MGAPRETSAASAAVAVRIYETTDANGNPVEAQAIVMINAQGDIITPMTEETAQAQLDELRMIRKCLVALAIFQTDSDPTDGYDPNTEGSES